MEVSRFLSTAMSSVEASSMVELGVARQCCDGNAKMHLMCHARLVSLPNQCHYPFAVSWLLDICCCDWIALFD